MGPSWVRSASKRVVARASCCRRCQATGCPRVTSRGSCFRAFRLCAELDVFSLHTGAWVAARDREKLEKLCRCAAWLAVAESRLAALAVAYTLKKRWREGCLGCACAGGGVLWLDAVYGWEPGRSAPLFAEQREVTDGDVRQLVALIRDRVPGPLLLSPISRKLAPGTILRDRDERLAVMPKEAVRSAQPQPSAVVLQDGERQRRDAGLLLHFGECLAVISIHGRVLA